MFLKYFWILEQEIADPEGLEIESDLKILNYLDSPISLATE